MSKRSWSFFSGCRGMELGASAAVMVTTLSGCGPRMVTVTFPERDGNSEYWVCDRQGEKCHGKQAGDVDPTLYEPGLSATLPHKDCPDGVARLEIIVKGSEILQLGYECAQPSARGAGPTGLPTGPAPPRSETGSDSTAVLPEVPPAGPTGLPPDAPEITEEGAVP